MTNLSSNLTDEEMASMGAITAAGQRGYDSYNDERITIPEGAATIVWCATAPELHQHGGVYCENCDIAPVAMDSSQRVGVKPWAVDKEQALRLWRETPSLFQI